MHEWLLEFVDVAAHGFLAKEIQGHFEGVHKCQEKEERRKKREDGR